jgi:hypothetical protein
VSGFLGVYEVVGKRSYMEHKPGERFEARLGRAAEARAVARGSIRLLERVAEDLPPNKYRLPTGWPGATERTG